MRRHAALTALMVLLACALACVCASCAVAPGAAVSAEQAYSDALRVYRNSSLVVMGKCVRVHEDTDGSSCSDLTISEVLAGTAAYGDTVHISKTSMNEGETYLLYLADGEDVYHTEDTAGYTLLTDSPLKIEEGGKVVFESAALELNELKRDIREQDDIIVSPSVTYYYNDLKSLTEAAEQIFIGKVENMPKERGVRFRANEGGETVENTLDASIMNVTALGIIKGTLNYGDSVKLVWCPAMAEGMTNAATLKTVGFKAEDATALEEGNVYLFFAVSNPDAKQDYFFGVNPIEGAASLNKSDRVLVTYRNAALTGYNSLELIVDSMKEYINN